MPQVPASQVYCDLIEKITRVYSRSNETARLTVARIRTQAYWEIGKYLFEVEQKSQVRAQYGDKLLKRLSKDLTQQLGAGFSQTNLKYMRQFYATHPSIGQTSDQLTWSQHTMLLSVKDDKKRKKLEKLCVQNNWKSRDLARVIKEEEIETEALNVQEAKPQLVAKLGGEIPEVKLKCVRGQLGLFRVVEHKGPGLPLGIKSLDLGFNIYRREVEGLCDYQHGDIVSLKERSAPIKLVAVEATKSSLYTYVAYLERVIDGDTLLVDIDCKTGVMTRQRLRLKGVDAPELTTKRGQLAKGFTERSLLSVEFIVVKTYGSDKYDRYLVDVFYAHGEDNPELVARCGKHFNQELIDEGFAIIYPP